MASHVRAPQGMTRVFQFQITKGTRSVDTSAFREFHVVVDAPDGTDKFSAGCPIDPADPTSRIVTLQGAATADYGFFSACIHWTDAEGLQDAEPFVLDVYRHA